MKSNPDTAHLEALVQEFKDIAMRATRGDRSKGLTDERAVEITTRAHMAIERFAPLGSIYRREAERIRTANGILAEKLERLVGVLQALSKDLKAGLTQSFEELIHGELFGDFLDMAQHLVDTGYKDAAAVIAGSSLKAHLRQLAKLVPVELTKTTQNGQEPKKAEALNADLTKAGAYSITDQKNVTAWLDLRNKAAHGKYSEYEKGQISIMIDGIRNFITRVPA